MILWNQNYLDFRIPFIEPRTTVKGIDGEKCWASIRIVHFQFSFQWYIRNGVVSRLHDFPLHRFCSIRINCQFVCVTTIQYRQAAPNREVSIGINNNLSMDVSSGQVLAMEFRLNIRFCSMMFVENGFFVSRFILYFALWIFDSLTIFCFEVEKKELLLGLLIVKYHTYILTKKKKFNTRWVHK